MNILNIANSSRLTSPKLLDLLDLPQNTDFVALGNLHGSQGLNPVYPQYLEYYTAWANSYRDFLLSAASSSDSSCPF
ncbi:MAG TPA: hypothetical protein ACFCUY_16300 [Xenococcaceae cyanobacterium]